MEVQWTDYPTDLIIVYNSLAATMARLGPFLACFILEPYYDLVLDISILDLEDFFLSKFIGCLSLIVYFFYSLKATWEIEPKGAYKMMALCLLFDLKGGSTVLLRLLLSIFFLTKLYGFPLLIYLVVTLTADYFCYMVG